MFDQRKLFKYLSVISREQLPYFASDTDDVQQETELKLNIFYLIINENVLLLLFFC